MNALFVSQMDDEDVSYAALGEPLYRVETGNYEYRLVLRCRSDARRRFAKLRSDVLVKLELLDNKHVQDIVFQLRRLMAGLTTFHADCAELMRGAKLFPIEVDLTRQSFQYKSTMPVVPNDGEEEDDEEEDEDMGGNVAELSSGMDLLGLEASNEVQEMPPPPPQSGFGDLLGLNGSQNVPRQEEKEDGETANLLGL